MQCPRCNAPLEEDATFCGNCGNQIAPVQAQGATFAVPAEQTQPSANIPNFAQSRYGSPGPSVQAPPQQARPYAPMPDTPAQGAIIPPPPRRPNIGRIVIIVALIVLVIAGGTIVLVLKNNSNTTIGSNTGGVATGLVRFVDSQNSQGRTDSLSLNISGLAAPPAGSQYNAWFVNDQEQIVKLGQLTPSSQGFSLNFAGHGTNLLSLGNKLEITVEQGTPNAPTGNIVLTATFPPKAVVHIRHLLLAFPITPNHIGLLVGVLGQTQQLNAQAQLLQNAEASHNTFTIQCVAQSMIDIIEGAHGHHYQPLSPVCASQNVNIVGDGFGLLGTNGYLALAAAHASLAATQSDSTPLIRVHAGHVEICITNIQGWVTTVDNDAIDLLAHPDHTFKVQEMVTLSDHAYHGVDINGDEQIDPVPGEGGAVTAYIHGQLMATLTLAANS
jgi:hypothetical protein